MSMEAAFKDLEELDAFLTPEPDLQATVASADPYQSAAAPREPAAPPKVGPLSSSYTSSTQKGLAPPPATALKQLRSPSKPPPQAAAKLLASSKGMGSSCKPPPQEAKAMPKPVNLPKSIAPKASANAEEAPPKETADGGKTRKADVLVPTTKARIDSIVSAASSSDARSSSGGQTTAGQCWIPLKPPKAQYGNKVAKTHSAAAPVSKATGADSLGYSDVRLASGSTASGSKDWFPKPPSAPPPSFLDSDEKSTRPWRSDAKKSDEKWSDSWSDEKWPGDEKPKWHHYGGSVWQSDEKWPEVHQKADEKWEQDNWWKSDEKWPEAHQKSDEKWQQESWWKSDKQKDSWWKSDEQWP